MQILRNYFKREILTILLLGFASGLPIVLILSTLKALLFDIKVDFITIGYLSLVTLPYSIKFLWAPIIDSISLPYLTKKLGKRRSWILFSQIILVFLIAVLGFYSQNHNLLLITILSILIGFTSATQDIVIDAFRIESVKAEDQGIATSMYIYGYRFGMLTSGAGALILSDIFSWDIVYYIMSLTMFVGMAAILIGKESVSQKIDKNHNIIDWFKSAVIDPLSDFIQRQNWHIILLFILFFKLGDAFAGAMTLPFLLDIDFSKTQIAAIVKTFGLFATLFGILLGGILVKYIGLINSLWAAAILQMLSNLAFYNQSIIGYNIILLYFTIFIENFSGGIGDAVFVAYLSRLCNKSFTATQYAVLISIATIGRSILSSTSGQFVEYLGWSNFFLLSTAAAIPGIFLLFILTYKTHDK